MRYSQKINQELRCYLEANSSAIIIGEDVLDPYGGAFKITKGLSESFPDQVLSTPISEQAITGFALGRALTGKLTIAEIMFADFMTLCCDQIINHTVKFREMFGHAIAIPLLVRTASGGGRGYGPTHSQSLEGLYYGFDALRLLSYSPFMNYQDTLRAIANDGMPSIMFEDKLIYSMSSSILDSCSVIEDNQFYTLFRVGDVPYPCNSSQNLFLTYGYGTIAVIQSLNKTAIAADFAVLSLKQLYPVEGFISDLKEILRSHRKAIYLEQAPVSTGVMARIHANLVDILLEQPALFLGPPSVPIPAGIKLEREHFDTFNSLIDYLKDFQNNYRYK